MTTYKDLGPIATILYSKFKRGELVLDDITKLLTAERITENESDYLKGLL
jgi:hypothetical protein